MAEQGGDVQDQGVGSGFEIQEGKTQSPNQKLNPIRGWSEARWLQREQELLNENERLKKKKDELAEITQVQAELIRFLQTERSS